MKCPNFHNFFSNLRNEWIVPEDVRKCLEEIVCVMYGYARVTSVNAVRTKMFQRMVGEDEPLTERSKVVLSRLLPCCDWLFTHIRRSNHCLACHKRAASPIFECRKPFEDQGWEMSVEGYIELLQSQCQFYRTHYRLRWLWCWSRRYWRNGCLLGWNLQWWKWWIWIGVKAVACFCFQTLFCVKFHWCFYCDGFFIVFIVMVFQILRFTPFVGYNLTFGLSITFEIWF